ncbi:MAG: PAS domain S-box protein [Caldilineaceae bacterium]
MSEICAECVHKLTQVEQELVQARARIAELERQLGTCTIPGLLSIVPAASNPNYLQKIIERCSDHVVLLDAACKILYSNSVERSLGYSVQEYMELGIPGLIHPEDLPNAMAVWRSVVESPKQTKKVILRVRHRQGHYVWIEVNSVNYLDDPGIGVVVSNTRDITDRVKSEDAEREQQRVAEALRDSLEALTASLDVSETMQQILNCALTVVPADAATILLIEGENIRVAYSRGIPAEHKEFLKDYRFSVHDPQFHKIIATRKPFSVADTREDENWIYFPVNGWIRSSLGIPLIIRDEVIGILHVDSKTPHHFKQEDIATLLNFARHASLALEHAYYVNRLEERVRERTAEFEASAVEIHDLYNNAPCGYHSLDKDGYVVQINDTELKWLGYRREEVVGVLKYSHLCTEKSQADFAINFQLLKEQGWLNNIEHDLVRKDGSILNMLINVTAIYDQQGEFVKGRTTLHDITALKQAREKLRQQRDLLQLVIDTVPSAIVLKGADGRYEMVNKHAASMYNLTTDQMIGKNDSESHPYPDEVAIFAAQDRYVRDTGEALFVRDNGFADFTLQTSVLPLKDAEGKVNRILVVSHDITERKRVESVLSEQRDFLNLVINQVPDLIMVKDDQGRFQLVNEPAAKVYGLTPAQMVGKTDMDLNPNVDEVAYYLAMDRVALDGGHTVFIPEERILERLYQTSKIPLRNSAGKYDRLLVVASDITEHKRAELLLQQALLKEKEVSELRTRFISMTSHEFRTPLTAILATAETLSTYRHKLNSEQIDKRLLKIQEQVNYLKDIMEDVLQLSRLQSQRPVLNRAAFDLDLLCLEVIEEIRSEFLAQHPLRYHCDDALKATALDKKLMRQIISNLLSNAVKYSPDCTPITLTASKIDGTLVLQVCDQGIGIPEDDLKHLFNPFHRATNVGTIAGTGLGMAITKESVEVQGGYLAVESAEGKGTSFTVHIPLRMETTV